MAPRVSYVSTPDTVRIEGLREFLRDLRRMGAEFPKMVREANKDIAEIVAAGTRDKLASGPAVAPKAAASVRSSATQRAAFVRLGGARWPFAMGANFGSNRFKQFQRPFAGKGRDYALFETMRERRQEIRGAIESRFDAIARIAFPD